jgi:hypothetical protein
MHRLRSRSLAQLAGLSGKIVGNVASTCWLYGSLNHWCMACQSTLNKPMLNVVAVVLCSSTLIYRVLSCWKWLENGINFVFQKREFLLGAFSRLIELEIMAWWMLYGCAADSHNKCGWWRCANVELILRGIVAHTMLYALIWSYQVGLAVAKALV